MDLLGKSRHPGGKEDTGLSGAGRIWNCWGGGGAGVLICSCLVFSPSISTLNPSEEEDNADHTPWIPLVTSQAFFLYSVVYVQLYSGIPGLCLWSWESYTLDIPQVIDSNPLSLCVFMYVCVCTCLCVSMITYHDDHMPWDIRGQPQVLVLIFQFETRPPVGCCIYEAWEFWGFSWLCLLSCCGRAGVTALFVGYRIQTQPSHFYS